MTDSRRRRAEQEVLAQLAGLLGHGLRDDIVADLRRRQWLAEVAQRANTVDKLAAEYRVLADIYPAPRRKKSDAEPRQPLQETLAPDGRAEALAAIMGIDAAADPAVIAYRHEVLGAQMLPVADIGRWIRDQARRDGKPTRWREISDDTQTARVVRADRLEFPGRAGAVEKIFVNARGVLGRLWRLQEALAVRYGWSKARATAFVLTGAAPPAVLGRATVQQRFAFQAAGRIAIEVDPRLTAAEVGALYSRVRGQVRTGRDKAMDAKHLTLAVWVAEHATTGEPWPALMAAWNTQYPHWKYGGSDSRNFARDARASWERVTGDAWPARPAGRRADQERRG